MPFDPHKNLAVATVDIPPSPGDTGTVLIVTAGQGARFPAPPFNVTLCPQAAIPTPLIAEVARVVAASGDQFTLERAQEGTTAQVVKVGYLMAETITAKALQDIESGTNFPLITTPGGITSGGAITGIALNVAHASTHSIAGSDPVAVTTLAGYPGNTTTFLRGDGTFANAAASGLPALHHTTHEPGGTDALVNAAWTNLPNVFTADQTISKTQPLLLLTYPGLAVDHRRWQIGMPFGNDSFAIHPISDSGALLAEPLRLERNGDAYVSGVLTAVGGLGVTPLNATQLLSGTVPDARLSVNVLKYTGGYPGGTANFLRADGTFAPPPGGGGVSPHASTHVVGGSDQITGAMAFSTLALTGSLSVAGDLVFTGAAAVRYIRTSTGDGADNQALYLTPAGAIGDDRGARISLQGNECASGGNISLVAGNTANGTIEFYTGASAVRGRVHPSGGFSWGSTVDPGAGNLSVAGRVISSVLGQYFLNSVPGTEGHYTELGNTDGPVCFGMDNNAGSLFNSGPGSSAFIWGATTGGVTLHAAHASGAIKFSTAGLQRGRIHPSGGFSWGSTIDPGAGALSSEVFKCTTTGTGSRLMTFSNADGATYIGQDNSAGSDLALGGGSLYAIYNTTPGGITLGAMHASGLIRFRVGGGAERGRMHASGGFSWGGTADPGAGNILVGAATIAPGSPHVLVAPGNLDFGNAGTGPAYPAVFNNANGQCGYIQTNGTATAYTTTSDARLKTDRGPLTDTDVLSRTVVHHFTWNTDGSEGRGVFAQEAINVAPFAVTEGTDERDDNGLLTHPWSVDYSKFVPDLIVGWQQHDTKVAALEATVARLDALIQRLLT